MENNEHLSYLLAPKGKVPQIGPEKGKSISDGIAIFQSTLPGPGVSYRFVYYEKGRPISALQIMKLNNGIAIVANVYTAPDKRRQGYGTKLMVKAKQLLGDITHSEDLSNAGAGWASAMQKLPEGLSRLQEAFRFWLNEAKFNPKSLDALASLKQKRQAVEDAGLPLMGEGSSRVVYLLDSKRVLKLAMNEQGIRQNRKEQEVFDSPMKPLVTQVFEVSQDGSWLVSELVRPLSSEEDFEALTGLPWVVVAMFLHENQRIRDPERTKEVMKVKFSKIPSKPYADTGKNLDTFFSKPWFQTILKLGSGFNVSDLTNLEHWGKTADQRVVLLDYGA